METAVPTYVTTDRKMAPGANTSPGLRSWSVVTMVTLYSLYTHITHLVHKSGPNLFYEKRLYFMCSSTNYT